MAIANNARNVSYGKPKYGGVAYRAPIGTPRPHQTNRSTARSRTSVI